MSGPDAAPVEALSPPRGRAILHWEGKQVPRRVPAPSAPEVERFSAAERDGSAGGGPCGLLLHGDNLEALGHLLAAGLRGRVKLVYIDPPFDSGARYTRRVSLRGKGTRTLLAEQLQYSDAWSGDSYLQFMYERLLALRELLAEDGALYLHCNRARSHHLRALLDEVFGEENFRNEIVVRRIRKNIRESARVPRLNEATDSVFFYAKSPAHRIQPPLKHQPQEERWHAFDAPNVRRNLEYPLFGHRPPPGRHWLKREAEAREMAERGDLRPHPRTGKPEYRIPASTHVLRDSLWDDVTAYAFGTGYPTEKKEELLENVVAMSTEPGDLVLDCFVGSGTTAAVAQRMGRRWIGCDLNPGAVRTAARRVQEVMERQAVGRRRGEEPPAQLSFGVRRVGEAAAGGHPEAEGRLSLAREDGRLQVRIEDFASPEILARLPAGEPPEWRRTVECVMIDPDYDGEVFRTALTDAPRRRQELVAGEYELPAPPRGSRVAVKVVDVLGGEALLSAEV